VRKVTCGPTACFDVDDTLVMWEIPNGFEEDLVTIQCRDYIELLAPNKYNINHLKKLAKRGHAIVVWSAGGSDWAEAVVKALELEDFVEVVMSKPHYLIDDMPSIKEAINAKLGYIDIDGNKLGHQSKFTKQTGENE